MIVFFDCACSSALFTFHDSCHFSLIKWNLHIQCRNGVIILLACSVEISINPKLSSEYRHLFRSSPDPQQTP